MLLNSQSLRCNITRRLSRNWQNKILWLWYTRKFYKTHPSHPTEGKRNASYDLEMFFSKFTTETQDATKENTKWYLPLERDSPCHSLLSKCYLSKECSCNRQSQLSETSTIFYKTKTMVIVVDLYSQFAKPKDQKKIVKWSLFKYLICHLETFVGVPTLPPPPLNTVW